MAATAINKRVWMDASKGAILPIASLMLIALMVVPMPAIMLDIGFISNIVISLAVLMVALNAAKPLDFSAFPTVLLFTTLLRLKNHHIGKLSPGRATQMEKLLGEILGEVSDFPRQLALQDQGRFALGYYHQRQAFFTKSTPEEKQ